MGNRTPQRGNRTPQRGRPNIRAPSLRRRTRRMRTPSPDSRDNENSEEALRPPPNIQRSLIDQLNNEDTNNTHQNQHDHTVRDDQRPDYRPDSNRARGGGEDVNSNRSEPVQPEIKF